MVCHHSEIIWGSALLVEGKTKKKTVEQPKLSFFVFFCLSLCTFTVTVVISG